MITEIITFALPEGMTREQVIANYRRSAPNWRANPDLIRKNDLYDEATRCGGGVYLWRGMEAARRARDAAWIARVRRTQSVMTAGGIAESLNHAIKQGDRAGGVSRCEHIPHLERDDGRRNRRKSESRDQTRR